MEFCIADTFTDSLARLTGDEQKAVKTTAFDLQINPVNPAVSFRKLDKAKDKNFWSVRVSRDIRLIVHRSEASRVCNFFKRRFDPRQDRENATREELLAVARPRSGQTTSVHQAART